MNTKRIAVILIAVAFSLVVIFSGIGILSVKKVQVNYALADETDSQEIQDILDELTYYSSIPMKLKNRLKTIIISKFCLWKNNSRTCFLLA